MSGMWHGRAICNSREGFTECAFPSVTFPQARAPSALRHSTFHITYFTAIGLTGLYDAPARDANSQYWDGPKEKNSKRNGN